MEYPLLSSSTVPGDKADVAAAVDGVSSTTASTKSVREGKVSVTFPGEDLTVFYNPVQEFNRDLSVAVIRQFIADRKAELATRDAVAVPETDKAQSSDDASKTGKNNAEVANGSPKPKRRKVMHEYDLHAGIRILEALSASGLRAIRYAKEVQGVGSVTANDFSETAVECIRRNIEANGVEAIVKPNFGDAILVMHEYKHNTKQFHVVDLDPYGSPSRFLDAAVQCVIDGGILMVTCTDMAVLCGNSTETCFSKYGSTCLRAKCCHEFALRIILRAIESHANRYSRYVEPLLSLSIDFYARIFVRVWSGQAKVKESVCKLSNAYVCSQCETISLQPLAKKQQLDKSVKFTNAFAPGVTETCAYCGGYNHVAGPIWNDKIHDFNFVKRLTDSVAAYGEAESLGTSKRILGMLSVVLEELPDVPLFYGIDRLCHTAKVPTPKLKVFKSAILNAGFRVSASHTLPTALKTDASNDALWDIVRSWAIHTKLKVSELPPESPAFKILSKPPSLKIDFSLRREAEPRPLLFPGIAGVSRFPANPEKNWGPKAKAKGRAQPNRDLARPAEPIPKCVTAI